MQTIYAVSEAVRYIEDHIDEKLGLNQVAAAMHYSKYHLHRIFNRTMGMTIHDYVRRRQLTEAAAHLAFSDRPISEIALLGGYESRQAFTDIFKAMYKTTPAKFREAETFYPLQLAISPCEAPICMDLDKEDITLAEPADTACWMELVNLAIDGYPRLREAEYLEKLRGYMADNRAWILKDEKRALGVMACSADMGTIDFLAVHPQYRRLGTTKLFLDRLFEELPPGREISLTTYRAGDQADTGYRKEYRRLGFVERELLVEQGYPVQRFVLCPGRERAHD